MNIGEDTRYLCDHGLALTNYISNHGDYDRQSGESMMRQVGRDGSVSVAAGGARQSNGNAELQALEYMETRIKAIDLVNRSYAQVVDADTETGGGDNPMYVKTKQTYESISQKFKRAFAPV